VLVELDSDCDEYEDELLELELTDVKLSLTLLVRLDELSLDVRLVDDVDDSD
jgi:hypothetical protein